MSLTFCAPRLNSVTFLSLSEVAFTPDHNIRVFRPNKNNQWKYLPVNNLKIGDKLRFPKHIQTDFTFNDSDFAWLIGLIIGDGHITKYGNIQICIKKDDLNIANKAKNILQSITTNKVSISNRNESKGILIVECCSKILGNWLREKIYNDGGKFIPDFIINSSQEIRISCLTGLFYADGTFKNKKCKRFVFSNTSYKLISQFSEILHSFGVKCSIREEIRNTNKKINAKIYRAVGYGKKNVETLCNIFDKNINVDEPYEYIITNIETIEYDDFVYNCEVDNDPSYVCYPGFVAHNCCGFKIWQKVIDGFPFKVFGDTPGLSKAAPSTQVLIEEYNKSLIFLNTSTISPVPTVLLEAMSCGCAVVSTATCMIPDSIQSGHNGFISNDVNELREKIVFLLQNPDIAKKIGINARETIKSRLGLDRFVNDWNKIFYSNLRYINDSNKCGILLPF